MDATMQIRKLSSVVRPRTGQPSPHEALTTGRYPIPAFAMGRLVDG